MNRGFVRVKEWFLDKQQDIARGYNCFIDTPERNEFGMAVVEDGFVQVWVDFVLGETEKAVHVVLATGEVVGSVKGWKCWIPKSCIAAI